METGSSAFAQEYSAAGTLPSDIQANARDLCRLDAEAGVHTLRKVGLQNELQAMGILGLQIAGDAVKPENVRDHRFADEKQIPLGGTIVVDDCSQFRQPG